MSSTSYQPIDTPSPKENYVRRLYQNLLNAWNRRNIALFQNTPAQFHGKPEIVKAMTEELRHLLRDAG